MSTQQVKDDLQAYISGDDAAGDRICRSLTAAIRSEVRRFLAADDPEHDDIVQESLLALLRYLRRAQHCPERPEAFVVTIAGNRCRNLYRWRKRRPTIELEQAASILPAGDTDPLDRLEDKEAEDGLIRAFAGLDSDCQQLLLAIYREERPMTALQREAGLRSVQAVYYRKYVCLRRLAALFNQDRSAGR